MSGYLAIATLILSFSSCVDGIRQKGTWIMSQHIPVLKDQMPPPDADGALLKMGGGKTGQDWVVRKVEASRISDALRASNDDHSGVILTVRPTANVDDATKNKDIELYLHYTGHIERKGETLTGWQSNLYPKDRVMAMINEPIPGKGGENEQLQLTKLLRCVNDNGLDDIAKNVGKINGACMMYTMRVMRFASGDCECGKCGDILTVQGMADHAAKLEKNAKAKIHLEEYGKQVRGGTEPSPQKGSTSAMNLIKGLCPA